MPPKNMTKYNMAIIGGDKRTACMAPILAEKGYRVICFRTVKMEYSQSVKNKIFFANSLKEALDFAPVIIGGIPFIKSDCLYCEETVSGSTINSLWFYYQQFRDTKKHPQTAENICWCDSRRIPPNLRRTGDCML